MILTWKTTVSAVRLSRPARINNFFLILFFTFLAGCHINSDTELNIPKAAEIIPPKNTDKLFVVDCLSPVQVRKSDTQTNDISSRRPVRTTAGECEMRGGEYVAYDRADVASASKVWLPQAEQGDAEAQVILGEIYEKGRGGTADPALAAQWYLKAAKKNNSRAQINLGYLYEKGLGVKMRAKKRARTAMNWYRKGAGFTHSNLQFASANEEMDNAGKRRQKATARNNALGSAYKSGHLQQVEKTRQQLVQSQEQLESLEAEYHDTFARIKKDMSNIESKVPQTGTTQEKLVVEKLREKLKQDKEKLLAQGSQINELKKTIEQERQNLASLENTPIIDIIDPQLTLINGMPSYQLKTMVRSKKIVGKVSAADNLKKLQINGQITPVSADGTFRSRVALTKALTPVKIMAVDKQDKSSVVTLNLLAKNQNDAGDKKRMPTKVSEKSYSSVDFGRFYALIIGNDDYKQLPTLKTSVNDAKAVDEMLRTRYGYKTTLLTNASQHQIMTALNDLRNELTEKDNLLIYYAGHGQVESDQNAYWLPSDAETDNKANWLSIHDISQYLSMLAAKHILVIADSCYSDVMTKTSIARLPETMSKKKHKKWLEFMNKRKGRTVMTSGGSEPLQDDDSSGHSAFANAFLEALGSNTGLLEDYELHRIVSGEFKQSTSQAGSQQSPQYAAIKHAGHEGSPFFFVPHSQ